MTSTFPYDTSYEPPGPVVPVGVSNGGDDTVLVPMLIDTGADVTLLPADLIARLRLPRIDTLVLTGFGGLRAHAPVHAATLSLAGRSLIARVVASSDALLGRDVLASFILELDGPRARLSLRTPTRPRRR